MKAEHNKVIDAAAKTLLKPLGLQRQAKSRVWLDDPKEDIWAPHGILTAAETAVDVTERMAFAPASFASLGI